MNEKNNPQKNRRVMTKIMVLLTGVVFLVFAGRFSSIMITKEVKGENLSEHVNQLYTRKSILPAKRGSIYDIGGNPIALDASSYTLVGVLTDRWSQDEKNPQHIVDKEKTASVLAQHISMSQEEILRILNQEGVDQVEFGLAGTNLSVTTKTAIEEEQLPGVTFRETPARFYPNGIFASHLVGYAAMDEKGEQLEGMMGIEQAYNDLLDGTAGEVVYQEDSHGYVIPETEQVVQEPVQGKDIYLTLDSRLQAYLETLMTKVYDEAKPESMVAMLVNPKTGAIMAATQRPTYNATTMEGIDKKWQNLLVEDSYEPGSTFKILTIAAGINEGVFDPNEIYTSGEIELDGGVVHDFNIVGWGDISYLEGFARSSNVMVVKLVEKMGLDVWEKYMRAFGIATPTDSGLANEASGNYNFNYEMEQASTAFGQGVTITPFQLMQAFTSIANDGKMMKLQYIHKIVDPVTKEETIMEPEVVDAPITPETAQKVLEYLQPVVYADYGTASAYKIENARIGAKTGTAELANPETGKYYTGWNEYLYSVVGFAPIEDPSYILYVTLKLPENTDKTFSMYLSEVFVPMMTRAVSYDSLGEEGSKNQTTVPATTGSAKEDAQKVLEEAGFTDVAVVGSGSRIVQQYPFEGTQALPNQKVILMTEGAMTMPDVNGWSKDDILKIGELTGTTFQFEGEGYAVSQDLPSGSVLGPDKQVTIVLE